MELIFIDGKFYNKEEAKVSVFDHGFLFGDGLFETMRAYDTVPFRLQDHLERLFYGADFLKINIPYSKEELADWVREIIKRNQLGNAYIRLTVTRGVGQPGLDPRTCPKGSVVIVALPLAPYPQAAYEQGWPATILAVVRNSVNALPPTIKSMNFLNNILAKLELIDKGKPEGFFLNQEGLLTEGVVSNLFFISRGKVFTPSVASGILPGITRRVVLEICAGLGVPVAEGEFVPEDLFQADECFVTNSLAEILPICQVDDQQIGTGKPGGLTKKLSNKYKEIVREAVGREI